MSGERRFATLIAAIYEAGADFRCWPEALRLMAQAFHAPSTMLHCMSPRVDDVFVLAPEVDPVALERYGTYYHRINPVLRPVVSMPVGTVLTDTMIMPKQELARTEFFNDFLLPLDHGSMLGATVHSVEGRLFCVVVQRRNEFEVDDIRLYRRLAPHLQRAVQLNVKLARLDMQCATYAELLDQLHQGAILVDAASRVLFANREAETLMTLRGGLRLVNGILRAQSASDTAKLHALIAASAVQTGEPRGADPGDVLLKLQRGPDRSPLMLSVLSLRSTAPAFISMSRGVAIVFATDPDRIPATPAAWIRLRYGLTAAETAFALEILKGDGIQACADRLGISRATARTHLSHIFCKTNTRRQAELIRALIQL